MTIDAHQHFWIFNPVRDSWITPEMQAIQKNFLPADLKPLLDTSQIDGCIAVQADQSNTETEFLLHLSQSNDFVKGVVGWVDLKRRDLYEVLEKYSLNETLKGFRHIVQAEPQGFMQDTDFIKGVRTLSAFDFTYDILIRADQLNEAYTFAKELPNVKLVLDHMAKPHIKSGNIVDWAADIRRLAGLPNVSCKLSGMVTEANWPGLKKTDFAPYLEVAVEAFGISRLMFGSDWPVCLIAADYKAVKEIVDDFFAPFSASEKQRIMGGNAVEFYNINE